MDKYKQKVNDVNRYLKKHVLDHIVNANFKEIAEHSLNGGKRLRSVLALIIGEQLDKTRNIEKLIVSIELLHNCSLIIDDLPCMDNDLYRRGKKTTHHKYGQAKAQALVMYFLKRSYELINENYHDIKKSHNPNNFESTYLDIIEHINNNLGYLGAAFGQYIDICPTNIFVDNKEYVKHYSSLEEICNLIYLKTTTFFEISFLPAYLLSGGSNTHKKEIKNAVKYFGLAFQISDDFEDIEQDTKRLNNSEYNPNIICKFGKKKTYEIYEESIIKFNNSISNLKLTHPVFGELIAFLNKRVHSIDLQK